MKKADLVKKVNERIGQSHLNLGASKFILRVIDECLSIIVEELEKGQDVKIAKFGVFKLKEAVKEGQESKKIFRFILKK